MSEILWATEEEKREQFHAETFPVDTRYKTHPTLSQLRWRAQVQSRLPRSEILRMTRPELVRLIDGHDPRD